MTEFLKNTIPGNKSSPDLMALNTAPTLKRYLSVIAKDKQERNTSSSMPSSNNPDDYEREEHERAVIKNFVGEINCKNGFKPVSDEVKKDWIEAK